MYPAATVPRLGPEDAERDHQAAQGVGVVADLSGLTPAFLGSIGRRGENGVGLLRGVCADLDP
jgi:hypothetical protein